MLQFGSERDHGSSHLLALLPWAHAKTGFPAACRHWDSGEAARSPAVTKEQDGPDDGTVGAQTLPTQCRLHS